jgi:hypothetical protein
MAPKFSFRKNEKNATAVNANSMHSVNVAECSGHNKDTEKGKLRSSVSVFDSDRRVQVRYQL